MKNIYNILLLWGALLIGSFVQAQFTVNQDFRGNGSPEIIIGDNAYLTSGVSDPVGAGWLRLTDAISNEKGYAYVNKSFPSTLGILVDFEYTMWRNNADNTFNGADGISIFLFDADYGPGNFSLGSYGGSLGYANGTQSNPPSGGVTGGYVGIGLDAYGNFVAESEGKNGGSDGVSPNSIALRGPTSDTNTNRYLAGVTILDNGNIVNALNKAGDPEDDIIDYNTVTSVRPSFSTFYRRVQLEIIPTPDNKYRLILRWSTTQGGAFTELIDYVTEDVPPSLLKIGFAASTGGGFNNQELRNLLITTPNNLRVTKKATKDILRSVNVDDGDNQIENQIDYIIEVVNDTDQPIDATFSDELIDINGDPISTSMFTIGTISSSGFDSININQVSGENKIEGDLTIPPNTTGYVTVTGTLNEIPTSNVLRNKVTVLSTGDDDFDLGNNTSIVNTPVIAENVDLVLEKTTIGDECLDPVSGNTYELRVINKGAENATYRRTGNSNSNNERRIVIIKDIPSDYTYNDSAPGGFSTTLTDASGTQRWTKVTLNNTPSSGFTRYVYIARGASNSDQTLAGGGTAMPYPLRYTITPPSDINSYTDQSIVEYRAANGNTAYNGANIESSFNPPNTANNTISQDVIVTPSPPTVDDKVYYCQGDDAQPLEATASSGNTLVWYLNPGGTPVTRPEPFTDSPGTTTYYVSQTNGNCESELAEIDVIVLENPTPGIIQGDQEICNNTIPNEISSTGTGSGSGFGTISYRWEQSEDNGNSWETISGATQEGYTPGALKKDTRFRRITIATNTDGASCESTATTAVEITTKRCSLITNPRIPSRAKGN